MKCPDCDKTFDKVRGLATHRRMIHTNHKPRTNVAKTIKKVKELAAEVGGLTELVEIATAIQ